jgi:ABC-type uncharacterized transport system auxiliary subunit
MRNFKPFIFSAFVTLLIAGCLSQPPVPSNHYYRLSDLPVVSSSPKKLVNGTVSVKRFKSDGLHSDRAILYGSIDRPLELKQYHYHHWADMPPRLIRDHLVQYLRDAGVADKVLAYTPAQKAEYIVNGHLHRFAQVLDDSSSKVVVEVELALSKNNDRTIILIKDYSRTLQVESGDMHAAVAAFSSALDEIYAEFLRDAAAAL